MQHPSKSVLVELSDQELSNMVSALSLFTSLNVGQWEAISWFMLRPGLLASLSKEEPGAQFNEVHELLMSIKSALGFPSDTCLAITDARVSAVAKDMYSLQQRLAKFAEQLKAVGPT